MADSIYRTRSLGVATEGVPDQYADGVAAKVWEVYIGDKKSRTETYCKFMGSLLQKYRCEHILDVACGTGVDSVLLLEQGYRVTSVDASDKMLKYALIERWNRRKEDAFDKWVIEEANWLTLPGDIDRPGAGYDAVICLGNSFAHLQDTSGDLRDIKTALRNFWQMIKPGGILIIDHRNYDYILDTGKTPAKNIYYNSKQVKDIQTSVLYVNGQASIITLDYVMDMSKLADKTTPSNPESSISKEERYSGLREDSHFRLSYYPHRLAQFIKLLDDIFGPDCKHHVYGDFKAVSSGADPPAFYVHVVQK